MTRGRQILSVSVATLACFVLMALTSSVCGLRIFNNAQGRPFSLKLVVPLR